MMYLLDTHILLWAIISPDRLSKKVRDILINSDNTILVSSISLGEISLKYASGKLLLENTSPEEFIKIARIMGFNFTGLAAEDAGTFYLLSGQHHKDPFDRMLIWQAVRNNYTFVSDDKYVNEYVAEGLKLIA